MATIQINQVRLKFQIKNAVTGTKNFFVISRHILILLIVIPFEYYFISLTVAAWQIASRELNGSSFTAPMNHHELYQSSSSSIVIIFFQFSYHNHLITYRAQLNHPDPSTNICYTREVVKNKPFFWDFVPNYG